MGAATTPVHGKMGAIYALRNNNFKGAGLNDVTLGTAYNGASTAYFEVVIDHAGTPDTFKWRVNGGAWTEDVAITGAAQTLSDGQQITFAATTGHTAGDQWVIGNLAAEATTESGSEAQITAAGNRLINPNAPPTFTDSGGKQVERVNFTNGKAVFSGNVGTVTVAGNNGYIPATALQKCGYLIDWNMNVNADMPGCPRMGQEWKESVSGQAGGSGGANAYFIGTETMFETMKASINGGAKYFLLQLFSNDPDQDQTGDHFNAWVSFTAFGLTGSVGDVVKEQISFQIYGEVSFTANA